MKFLRLFFLFGIIAFTGCAGLGSGELRGQVRGSHDGKVFSSSRPSVTVHANLPYLASFRGQPQITTLNRPASPQVWGSVYGAGDRLAVVAITEAPYGWEWLFPPQNVGGFRSADTRLNEYDFSVRTLVLPVEKDTFAPFAKKVEGGGGQWLVRRFTRLDNFMRVKLIMEYREAYYGDDIPTEDMSGFENRARHIFNIAPGECLSPDDVWLDAVDSRYFTRFLGRMDLRSERRDGGM